MQRAKAFQSEQFEEAKIRFPYAMQKLLLAVKQDLPVPRMEHGELKGLCALGILGLNEGGLKARPRIEEAAVPLLQQTKLVELQAIVVAQRQQPPVSGVRVKADADVPAALRTATRSVLLT